AEKNIEKLAETVLKHVDLSLFRSKNPLANKPQSMASYSVIPACRESFLAEGLRTSRNDKNTIIAVAYDKAFCFYYEDNLDLLKNAGAEIVTFSPLSDSAIPHQADAVYIGGGYPELYAKELSENTSMMKSINGWANSGKPIYAECGGLMYLSKGIYDFNGKFFEMAGVFPFETQIPPCPPLIKGGEGGLRPHLGYREIILKEDCILGKKGDKLKGHEFHYSEIVKGQAEGTVPDLRTERSGIVESGLSLSVGRGITDKVYSVRNNHGELVSTSGYKSKNTLASYIHIHFGSNSEIVWNFLNRIKEQ
ncbi:MAG: hypothetical protein L6245_03140, partial [Thermodesulfovibrionales bacterium]|nr:hypothetical protein [Thermodesulfovibrionales bacterium]